MKEEEKLLLENAKEFYSKGKEMKREEAWNSSVTLFFKAIAVLVDLFLLREEGEIPSNHSQRFRILERKYGKLYKILDKDFPIYQDSYRLKLGKDYAEVLENDMEEVVEYTGIEIES